MSGRGRWAAAHAHVCARLFAVAGAAGASGDPSDAAIALSALAGELAWHAELLEALLPRRAGVDPAALVAAGVDGWDAACDALAADAARGDAAAVTVVLVRVLLPRLAASVRAELADVDPRLEGPRARTLTLVGRDLADGVAALQGPAERALGAPGALATLANRCVEVERAIVDAPGSGAPVASDRGG